MAARRALGGVERTRELHRDARSFRWLNDLRQDVRIAVRSLKRAPGFTAIVLVTLAFGIGATTTVYSVVDTVLLRPLPFPESDRLVRVVEDVHLTGDLRGRSVGQRGISYQDFLEWRAETKTLADATAVMPLRRTVRTEQGVARLWGIGVSSQAFALIGGRAMLGRTLGVTDADDSGVIVLSFGAWRRHFNSDPSVIGTAIQRPTSPGQPASEPLVVVGVMPPDFEFPAAQLTRDEGGGEDFLAPIPNGPMQKLTRVTMIARLARGATIAAAQHEANIIGASIQPPAPVETAALAVPRFDVQPLKDLIVGQQRSVLQALLGAVVILLLIVCANLSNLLLARGTAKRRETAVRLAIGASRGRLVRQMLTESAVLALAGGAAGAGIGAAGVGLVKVLASVDAPGIFQLTLGSTILPRVQEVGIDVRVLGIAFGVATVTSVLFGVWPALRLSGAESATRDDSHRASEPGVRALLVVAQVAMATTLLVSAGLLAHSFANASNVDNGYDPSNVVSLDLLVPNPYSIAQKVDTIESLLARLRARHDVQAAGFARHGLLIGERLSIGTFVPPGGTVAQFSRARTRVRSVSQGWLTTMGVPVIEGRDFQAGDVPSGPPAIVLNRSAARRYFGRANPVGQTLDWHFEDGSTQMTVIGVVEDLRQDSPLDGVFPEVFVEYRQFLLLLDRWKQSPLYQSEWALGVFSVAVKTRNDPAIAIPVIRETVNAVDPNVAVDSVASMDRLLGGALARQRFYAAFLVAFAAIASLLAVIGVYGVLAYAVSRRTREFGIRIALGAPRTRLSGRVVGRGLILTTVGITLGLIAAAAVTWILQGLLFGITPLDPSTFVEVAVIFSLVTTVASYVPARRATNVDPMVILRSE